MVFGACVGVVANKRCYVVANEMVFRPSVKGLGSRYGLFVASLHVRVW